MDGQFYNLRVSIDLLSLPLVASSALLIYDIELNIDVEMDHIWKREWSIITALYTIQRYLPLFDTVVVIYLLEPVDAVLQPALSQLSSYSDHFTENPSENFCNITYRIIGCKSTRSLNRQAYTTRSF